MVAAAVVISFDALLNLEAKDSRFRRKFIDDFFSVQKRRYPFAGVVKEKEGDIVSRRDTFVYEGLFTLQPNSVAPLRACMGHDFQLLPADDGARGQ